VADSFARRGEGQARPMRSPGLEARNKRITKRVCTVDEGSASTTHPTESF
jgi:hypothetical protein